MKKLRGRRSGGKSARRRARRRARFGAPDASLTGSAGVLAVGELMDRLGVIEGLDAGIGPIKTRALGVTGGELVASLAQCQLLDGKFVAALDRHRADAAAQLLSAVPAVASTTAGGLTRCFGPDRVAGIEAGNTTIIARGWERLGEQRRAAVLAGRIGIDLDPTDVEVYGRLKRGVAYNYQGQRAGRPHLATWADTGLTLAADLLTGVQDVRSHSSGLLGRAVAALPDDVRDSFSDTHRPVVRADAGYFAAELAHTAVGLGCDFAVAAKRNPAMWRAAAAVPEHDWSAAHRMTGAQVAVSDYAPAGWPPGTYTIIRRVRIDAAEHLPGYDGTPSRWRRPPARTGHPVGLCREWSPVDEGIRWVSPRELAAHWDSAALMVVTVPALPDVPVALSSRTGVYVGAGGPVSEAEWQRVAAGPSPVLVEMPAGERWLREELTAVATGAPPATLTTLW